MTASRIFIILLLAITAGALAFRLPRLTQRPMHVDEAVQAVKFGELYEHGAYRYDPTEYHGPALNYLNLIPAWLGAAPGKTFAEANEFTCRIVPVLAGAAAILLLLLIAPGIGRAPAVVAGVLTAISPMLVYYNRYYIHETLLVCFTFAFIACAWRWFGATPSPVTRHSSLVWPLAAGASLALMHATKETFIISLIALFCAALASRLWARLMREEIRNPQSDVRSLSRAMLAFLAAYALVWLVLFSSFFTNWRGLYDSFATYGNYFKQAGAGNHIHPWWFYLHRIVFYWDGGRAPVFSEAFIVFLALIGFIAALIGRGLPKAHVPLTRFLGFYTAALTIGYSLISYKTPWCAMTFLHGMILVAGVGAAVVVRAMPHWSLKTLASLVLLAGTVHLGWTAYRSSYKFAADPVNPWVYAHTRPDILNLEKRAEEIAAVDPKGHDMLVRVITRDYWPVPWYLRRFRHVGYWHEPPADSDAPFIISAPDVEDALAAALHQKYQMEYVANRPEAFFQIYVRQDLWKKMIELRSAKPPPRATAGSSSSAPSEKRN